MIRIKKDIWNFEKTTIKKIFEQIRRTSNEKLQYTIYKETMDALMSKLTFGLLYWYKLNFLLATFDPRLLTTICPVPCWI